MLRVNDLTYRIGDRLILDAASFTIPEGARVGLVGRNGAGKTTLFKAILGDLSIDAKSVSLPKGMRIGAVAQEAPAGPETLHSVVLAADTERARLMEEAEQADGLRRAEIETRLVDIGAHSAPARAAAILHGLGFDAAAQARPCSDFSGGWRMRVALAAVLFSEPDLLLLDEPTNYLDIEGTLWLYDYLERYPALPSSSATTATCWTPASITSFISTGASSRSTAAATRASPGSLLRSGPSRPRPR